MKATGIVRRIDDLGRVVIPKEIRRTQLIRVGDPLEIFVSGEGEVVFKKYSPIGELASFAQDYVDLAVKVAGITCLVTDRDHVVAMPSALRKLEGRRLSEKFDEAMLTRRLYEPPEPLPVCMGETQTVTLVAPIVSRGDLIGAVAVVAGAPTELHASHARLAAALLGKQMEE